MSLAAEAKELPLDLLDDPSAPLRHAMADAGIQDLVDSIARHGLLQPLVVRCVGVRYEVVAGHRRLRALRFLNVPSVPCRVVADTPLRLKLAAAHENLIREDLSPVEEAHLVKEVYDGEGEDVDRVARLLRRSLSWVEARLDLLGWPLEIRDAVDSRSLSVAAARPLARVTDPAHREYFLRSAVQCGATARVTEAWVQQWLVTNNPLDPTLSGRSLVGPQLAPEVPSVACFLCTRKTPIDRAVYQRFCPPCAQALDETRPELIAALSAPPPSPAPS